MKPSRRFHLILPADLESQLRTFAHEAGLGLAAALRHLATKALSYDEARSGQDQGDSAATLATLCAAEHAVLMVASVLPEGQRRMRELSAQAAAAAEERLATIREAGR